MEADRAHNVRLYAWAPRHEVVFVQAVVDAYEGLARVRTERHDGERSLLLFLSQPSQQTDLRALLHSLSSELSSPITFLENDGSR